MSQQKQEPYTPPTTPTKLRQEKPFVLVKDVLTEVQLDAIAGGAIGIN